MWKTISSWFLSGLAVLVPVLVAAYILIWAFTGIESSTRSVLLLVIPERLYLPGAGLAVTVVIVLALGIASRTWLTRTLLKAVENLLSRIPLFSSIYKPTKDLMDMLKGDLTDNLGQPVMITVPNTDMETLGFITRPDTKDLPDAFSNGDRVVVYVQWSSQIGGYCFLVPRDHVRELPISVEEGMRWALTAGLSLRSRDGEPEASAEDKESTQER